MPSKCPRPTTAYVNVGKTRLGVLCFQKETKHYEGGVRDLQSVYDLREIKL